MWKNREKLVNKKMVNGRKIRWKNEFFKTELIVLIIYLTITTVVAYDYNFTFMATTPLTPAPTPTPTPSYPKYEKILINNNHNNHNYNNNNNNNINFNQNNIQNNVNSKNINSNYHDENRRENLTQINDRVLKIKKLNHQQQQFINKKLLKRNDTVKQILTGNTLWDGVITDCLKKPTFSCIQKNVYSYLDDTLGLDDVNVTNRFLFKKNKIDFVKYTKEANEQYNKDDDDEDNELPEFAGRSDTPIEEVTNSLYGKGVKFMMTHDLELKMPEMLFDGSTFRVSPRSIEGNGVIAKIEFLPRHQEGDGRLLFKKLKKFFKNKILLSFLAIVLVIKLIKIKLFWILPFFIGAATVKKLVLKFLLFLFPAFSQIFKLCSWYHNNYHQTKYHHHQHHINHLHTILPQWHNEEIHEHHDHHDHHEHGAYGADIAYSHPPKGHPAEYIHGAPPPPPSGPAASHSYQQADWDFSGPGLGSEYIGDIHRNAHSNNNNFKPKFDDLKEINSWGLGTTFAPVSSYSYNTNPLTQQDGGRYKAQANSLNPIYVTPQQPRNPNAAQIAAQYNNNQGIDSQIIRDQRLQAQEALRIQQEQKLILQQQKILQQQPFVSDIQLNTINQIIVDPFYSPILSKMDKVFQQLGFHDEFCRERLVCSMYKYPSKYSPHSNYISAELSRDSSELQKPQSTNAAVVKFYRYVQAARDGQDQRDCLRLYPHCVIATE